jgi:arylsulfatase A-like enzyme
MGGTRAIWHQGWKAAALSPAAPDMWARYATQRWELFNTEEDPSECHDLAAQEPEKLQELIDLWWAQAGQMVRCRWRTAVPLRSSPPNGPS